ncbi:glutamate 5-kinase [Sphingosinicella sp. LY1275]|uniref:glutamate 5-kinase n=1 Tax=Sphingosinicella sp. LY1275 TaxID=3095379 RepID=UPI002ADEFBC0|nr:glutamate 5-kinase [Sphingosinicella sp. LY1275]MEA1016025.1 glutamate 5-kinase [Sphingosinicella sp. LY1275]
MAQKQGQYAQSAASLIGAARRVTIKIGSSLLVDGEGSGVRRDWLASLGEDIAALRAEGRQVIVVSSGAVALGRRKIGLGRSPRLANKQAAAAAGQSLLMQAWETALAPHGIATAQLLLTLDDTEQRRRWLNARATMEVLLAQGALPVINENDSVATDELRYGDNDRLSARAAQMIRSDMLILLSDVDGLYTADPANHADARHIPFVDELTPEIEGWASGPAAAGPGTGGMRTKLAAARIARAAGCSTLIACGRDPHPIRRLLEGAKATVIAAGMSPASAYKQWIAGALAPAGAVAIDDGAAKALKGGKSLLPAGVTDVTGRFERGVCLRVVDGAGREVARGITAYSSAEAGAIAGCGSDRIAERLGYSGPDELIHRDDMVML